MNTNKWGDLKSEVWRIFKKWSWNELKLKNLKEWLIHKGIRYRILDDQYYYKELDSQYYYKELVSYETINVR